MLWMFPLERQKTVNHLEMERERETWMENKWSRQGQCYFAPAEEEKMKENP